MMRKASLPLIPLIPLLALALAACPKDKKVAARDTVPTVALDTTPADLSATTSNIPAAAPDTFKPVKLPTASPSSAASANYAAAPAPLQAAVEREQAFQRFCYQEFGLKADPSLAGNVAMMVTVGSNGVSNTSVANSKWTSRSGRAVNTCLAQKAQQAWKLDPGAVKPGRYVVQLSFRGS
jgi:hypothetical protein